MGLASLIYLKSECREITGSSLCLFSRQLYSAYMYSGFAGYISRGSWMLKKQRSGKQ